MALKEKMVDDVAILTPKGKLMGGPETVSVHDKIKELINTEVKKVVIDLGKVKWMNSSGLGALMGAMTSVRNADGDLKLANVTDKVIGRPHLIHDIVQDHAGEPQHFLTRDETIGFIEDIQALDAKVEDAPVLTTHQLTELLLDEPTAGETRTGAR